MKEEIDLFSDRIIARDRIHEITVALEGVLDTKKVLGVELLAALKNLHARNPDLQVSFQRPPQEGVETREKPETRGKLNFGTPRPVENK